MELLINLSEENESMSAILNWIDLNSSSFVKNEAWEVGITNLNSLPQIQLSVMEDIESVNWKSWSLDSFDEAFSLLISLNKNPKIIKSRFNNYLEKGTVLFTYKTQIKRTELLGHLRNYYGNLRVSH